MNRVVKRLKGLLIALMHVAAYYIVSWLVYNVCFVWKLAGGRLSVAQIEESIDSGTYALSVIASILCLWLYMLIGKVRKKPLAENIGTQYVPSIFYVMAACLAVGCRFLVAVYYSFAQKSDVLQNSIEKVAVNSPDIGSASQMIIALFAVIIVAPLFEELLFRGIVMGEFMKIMRPWAAITLQALVFAIAHGSLFQSIFTFVIGIIIGVVYYRTQNIKTAVVCHGVFNFSPVLMQENLNLKGALVFVAAGILLTTLSLFYIITNSKKR